MKFVGHTFALCLAALTITAAALAQQKPYTNDLNENFKLPPVAHDYNKLYEFFAEDIDGNFIRVFYDYAWEECEGARSSSS